MSAPAITRLARAIDGRSERVVERRATRSVEAVVVGRDPLRLDVAGQDVQLTEDDVEFGELLRQSIDGEPLQRDDSLVLVEVAPGDYVAVDLHRDERDETAYPSRAAVKAHIEAEQAHGLPEIASGEGLLWQGGGWTTQDVATAAEHAALEERVDTAEEGLAVAQAGRNYVSGGWGAATNMALNAWTTLPLFAGDLVNTPAGAFTRSGGGLVVNEAGTYLFSFTVLINAPSSVRHATVSTTPNAQGFLAEALINTGQIVFPGMGAARLVAGQALYVTAVSSVATTGQVRLFSVHRVGV